MPHSSLDDLVLMCCGALVGAVAVWIVLEQFELASRLDLVELDRPVIEAIFRRLDALEDSATVELKREEG